MIPSGSLLVNLGSTQQSTANGLRPYGLVYAMLKDFRVPVKWVINPSKSRDGVDFTYNNTDFKGGAFIILSQYRTSQVNAAITQWITSGVIGVTTASDITVQVYATLTYAPRWTIDKANGSLIVDFFKNAGIPADAHGGAQASAWKNPADLTECDDIFGLPHADPTFATHNNLLAWNRDFKGAIWSGCHAASVMENIGLNFLTTKGMMNYSSHIQGTPPYQYSNPTDPIMQFIGSLDLASNNGSESIYLPAVGSSWRSGVKLSVIQQVHANVPTPSAGPAAVVAYGRGYDDESRGYVMYQGGHFHNGISSAIPPSPDHVALQRAFFNFSFLAVVDRQNTSILPRIVADAIMVPEKAYPVTFALPTGTSLPAGYSFRWSASAGTITPSDNVKDIQYTPPNDPAIKIALLSLVVTDPCGRQYFQTMNIAVNHCSEPPFVPVIAIDPLLSNDRIHIAKLDLPAGIDPAKYTVKWKVSNGTIVGNDDETQISYKPPLSRDVTSVTITVTMENKCGIVFTGTVRVAIDHQIRNNGRVTPVKLVSPNTDGQGYDFFYLDNIELYPANELLVYNRWGNVVYEVRGYDNDRIRFTGKSTTGEDVTNGVFYYLLKIKSPDVPKESALIKGFFILKR